MTFMLAAASICTTDALERQLAPSGFQCCERDLLGRSKPRDWATHKFPPKSDSETFSRTPKTNLGAEKMFSDSMLWEGRVVIPRTIGGGGLLASRTAQMGIANPGLRNS